MGGKDLRALRNGGEKWGEVFRPPENGGENEGGISPNPGFESF